MRVAIPLSRRPPDLALVACFAVNLCFTTYVVGLEQIGIAFARLLPRRVSIRIMGRAARRLHG